MANSYNKRPTIRDVARKAGVSHQTVSRVLNDQPRVSPRTRQRVLRAMDELGYQRNVAAQMLTTQRSQTIQLIAVDMQFAIDVNALTLRARENGYMTLLLECTKDTLPQAFDMAAARLIDGINIYAPRLNIEDDELVKMSHGIPFVRRDYVIDSRLTWVAFDQRRAAEMIVQHLIDQGHEHIASVTGAMSFINAYYRYEAYLATLESNGLQPGPVAYGDYSTTEKAMQTGYEGTKEIIKSGRKFTALVVVNDYMALGALHALREHNLCVPGHVAIGSFDNLPHTRFTNPPLTSVEFNFALQDRLTFDYLFERIANPDAEHIQHVLMPNLVVRESTVG